MTDFGSCHGKTKITKMKRTLQRTRNLSIIKEEERSMSENQECETFLNVFPRRLTEKKYLRLSRVQAV